MFCLRVSALDWRVFARTHVLCAPSSDDFGNGLAAGCSDGNEVSRDALRGDARSYGIGLPMGRKHNRETNAWGRGEEGGGKESYHKRVVACCFRISVSKT